LTKELCAKSLDTVHITVITIITNDNDYIQLLDNPAIDANKAIVYVKNLVNKDLLERVDYSPRVYLKVKTILGDKSDNIPSIISKCGDKTAFKLATDVDKLEKVLEESPAAKSQYMLNQLLIDFDNIPKSYHEEVIENIIISNSI
jgi:5'-3' exonuclease